MKYAVAAILIGLVAWRAYKIIFPGDKTVDLTNPNIGRGPKRPDKPNDLNEM